MKRLPRFMGAILFLCYLLQCKWGVVAAGEEAVDVGSGVPLFVAVAGVAEEGHQGFVIIYV